jgi:hypothetical protein
MEQLIILPSNLLIAGDFNYHVDNSTNPDTIKFNKILESFNLQQHVNGPTHKKGYTLDLIITRIGDRLVTNIEIHDPMFSDHSAVSCTLQLEKLPLERAEIQYRKLRSINMDSFNEDLRKSNFSSDSELPTIIDQYEKTFGRNFTETCAFKTKNSVLLSGYQHHGITRKLVKPKDSVEDSSVVGEHLNCALTKRYILNNVR